MQITDRLDVINMSILRSLNCHFNELNVSPAACYTPAGNTVYFVLSQVTESEPPLDHRKKTYASVFITIT
jgi:hypothetical protein